MTNRTGLIVENATTGYDSADVLYGVSLNAEPGKITCLLGSNGAGKSTLVRLILGLTPARLGRVSFNGRDITRMQTHKVISEGIACIPEGRMVFSKCTVEENLLLGGYGEKDDALLTKRMKTVYDLFPRLAERKQQLAGTMSGGEQAMVSIGRGLMSEPSLLIIDEPSLGLSPLLVKENFKIIKEINERGISILLIEQNVRQTLAIAHYGYVLTQGKVVAAGTAQELLKDETMHAAYFG
ncbi:ABC transporter ATP-binding protein [Sneathiella sp.]|uniref:ABC transporter ATP-binding protein n=1 Tax=Sneathiella sp. TaxID=1964365 RepID=UPI00261B4220|nr:ABC transporter ATP-binding protein [Sneathiella sp.]MDF2365648.1 ABC transporter ATP-binding protein [Sneathiella sp.]